MKFRKVIATFEIFNNHWELKNSSGKIVASVNLLYNTTFSSNKSTEDIFVFFNCDDVELLNAKSKDFIFFDISGVKCSFKTTYFSKELRAVFSRYGIRFDTIFN
jgi:hypothetical protein